MKCGVINNNHHRQRYQRIAHALASAPQQNHQPSWRKAAAKRAGGAPRKTHHVPRNR